MHFQLLSSALGYTVRCRDHNPVEIPLKFGRDPTKIRSRSRRDLALAVIRDAEWQWWS